MGLGVRAGPCDDVQCTITIHIHDRRSGLIGQPTHHRIWIAPEVVIMYSLQNQFATLPNPGEVNQYDITDRRLPLPARGNVTWKRVANQAHVMTVEVRETIAGHRTDGVLRTVEMGATADCDQRDQNHSHKLSDTVLHGDDPAPAN